MRTKIFGATFLLIFLATFSTLAFGAKPENRWTRLDGNKIHYLDVGSRKEKNALVLIHGWTCNADFWKDSYEAFPYNRVLAVDLPGHGQSDKPKLAYTMEYFAKAIAAVVNDAGVENVVLVGHSMGTPIAREFYRMHPDRTRGIIIVDGALKTFFPKSVADSMINAMRANYAESSAKFVDGMLMPVRDEALRKYIRNSMISTPDYVAISAMEGMADEKIWKDDKINVPVLALMAQSPFWPADVKEIFTSIAPNIDFQMWTGVSHFLHMEKPKEFNEQVRLFVTKNKLL